MLYLIMTKSSGKCKFEGCTKYSSYKDSMSGKIMWCAKHRKKDDFSASKCRFRGCTIRASYRNGMSGKIMWCAKHRKEGDFHVNKCKFEGCIKIASYKDKTSGKIMWCAKHREENPSTSIDIDMIDGMNVVAEARENLEHEAIMGLIEIFRAY